MPQLYGVITIPKRQKLPTSNATSLKSQKTQKCFNASKNRLRKIISLTVPKKNRKGSFSKRNILNRNSDYATIVNDERKITVIRPIWILFGWNCVLKRISALESKFIFWSTMIYQALVFAWTNWGKNVNNSSGLLQLYFDAAYLCGPMGDALSEEEEERVAMGIIPEGYTEYLLKRRCFHFHSTSYPLIMMVSRYSICDVSNSTSQGKWVN